ncbi:MAG: cytochrome c family protein [Hyphomicrobiales bacterium]|nr:cytochrome c family protein [Hyphomicrobiales bacterium]
MDSFEWTKIAGSVLGALLLALLLRALSDVTFAVAEPEKPGFEIALAESDEGASSGGEAADEVASIGSRLAAADVAAGEKIFKKCAACHTIDNGGQNKVGPNLWGVVGRAKGTKDGFSYSSALQGLGGEWTFDDLDHFLTKPKDFAAGTTMGFAGLKKPGDRAAVIAYLNAQSDAPVAIPSE